MKARVTQLLCEFNSQRALNGNRRAEMRGMKAFSRIAVLAFGLGVAGGAFAQTAGQDLKNAGRDTKDAAKDTAHGVSKGAKTGARKTKDGVKKGAHAAASGTEKGAAKVKQKTE